MLRFLRLPPLSFLFLPSLIIASMAITYNLSASIRLDEAQSIWAATKSVTGIIKYIAQDVHVPLYPLLLHFWIKFFGTDIATLRLMSVIFFVISIPLLYIMANRTGGGRVALITVSLYCLSPFLSWYSTEARMYTLLTLSSILSHLTFFNVFRSEAAEGKTAYVLSSVLGLYVHYFFGIILALQAVYFLVHHYKQKKLMTDTKKSMISQLNLKSLSKYLLVLTLIGLSFLPWLTYLFQSGGASNTKPLLTAPTSYNLLQIFVHFFTGFQSPTIQSALISIWPLGVILLFFTFSRKKKLQFLFNDYYFVMTFAPVVIALIVSYLFQPMLLSRYLIFITPTLFYLLAVLLVHFNKFIFWSFMAIVFAGNLFFQYQQSLSNKIEERESYEQVANYLSQNTTESDVIAVSAPFTVYPIEYNYWGRAKIETIPYWNRYQTGSIPPFTAVDLDQQVERYKSQHQRLFLVLSYDQGYEEEVRRYFDNSLQMNKHLIFSPGLQVREYQLQYD